MTRGWEKIYLQSEVGEDGLTARQRAFQASVIASEKRDDEMIQREVDAIDLKKLLLQDEPGLEIGRSSNETRKQDSSRSTSAMLPTRASTLRARNAAAALSRPPSSATVRSDTANSTSSSMTKTGLLPPRRTASTRQANASNVRHAVAAASSRTTVGYSRGRSVSSTLPNKPVKESATNQKPSQRKSVMSPQTYVQLYGAPPIGSEMWKRCEEAGCLPEQEVIPLSDDELILPLLEEDEETRNFQLTL